MKTYISIKTDEIWTSSVSATFDCDKGVWERSRPMLYDPNSWEWFEHSMLGRHFSFGQPYCVVCGYAEAKQTNV